MTNSERKAAEKAEERRKKAAGLVWIHGAWVRKEDAPAILRKIAASRAEFEEVKRDEK